MVLALERLGRKAEAARLLPHFSKFADTEKDSKNALQRAQARYLLALIATHDGDSESARKLLADALQAEPDLLAARLELRGDVVPISSNS
jgi:Tfp pilus assembly protein PilF